MPGLDDVYGAGLAWQSRRLARHTPDSEIACLMYVLPKYCSHAFCIGSIHTRTRRQTLSTGYRCSEFIQQLFQINMCVCVYVYFEVTQPPFTSTLQHCGRKAIAA